MQARARIALVALLGAWGCDDDEGGDVALVTPTEVAVAPDDFLGEVACTSLEGGARSYVMTLLTHDPETEPSAVTVGSTHPVPCATSAGFREVIVVGRRYTAEIDVYEAPASALSPLGGRSSGSRQMLRDGEPLAPRWTTRCGGAPDSAPRAVENRRVWVRPCDPLSDAESSATQLLLAPEDVLGPDPCEVAPSLDATFLNANVAPVSDLACDGDPVVLEARDGLAYAIHATATVDGTLHGATCEATGHAGLTVRPDCAALTATGTVLVSLAELGDEGALCPAGGHYDLFSDGEPLNALPLSCQDEAHLGPIEPGVHVFDAVIRDAEGNTLDVGASCAAEVVPGRAVEALCTPTF